MGVRTDDRAAARAISGLLRPSGDPEVAVRIDGVGAGHIDPTIYRAQIVVAPHHGALFSGTIAENLTTPTSPTRRWEAAMEVAACGDFLAAAGGLDGQVGESGSRLSGGQHSSSPTDSPKPPPVTASSSWTLGASSNKAPTMN